jgi:DNA-binding NtrC family response regulator
MVYSLYSEAYQNRIYVRSLAGYLLRFVSAGVRHLMKRVLVVDDDRSILQVARMILDRSGFTTVSADNATQALTLLQHQNIDLLLTDLVMPGMSGGELIEEARKRQPDLPVCCMTAFIPLVHSDLERVLIIPKPFAPRALIDAVRHVLEARPQRKVQVGGSSAGSLQTPGDQIHEAKTLVR